MNKNKILIALILIGLVAGLISFVHRYRAEAMNRRVELVVDWADAQALANTTSRAIDDVLIQLRNSGVTTIAVTEDSLDTLRVNGIVSYQRDGNDTLLTFAPGFPGQCDRVFQMLTHKTGLAVTREGVNSLRVAAPWPQFDGVPIGMDETVVRTVRQDHLLVAPRLSNYTGVTAENIDWDLGQAQAQCGAHGTGPFIFAGAAVLGNRPLIRQTADDMIKRGLIYGTVEFAKTFGDDDLSRFAASQTVRVHSIGNDEMGTMDEPTAVERFVRAARERNIRVCYVRLFINGLVNRPGDDVITTNTEFVGEIVKGLKEAHLTVGASHPFQDNRVHPYLGDPTPARWMLILMGIGVMAGVLLLLRAFTGINGRAYQIAFTICMLLGIGLGYPHGAKAHEILALLAACTFPTLGLCLFPLPSSSTVPKNASGQITLRAFPTYVRITSSTVTGVIFVVGLLAGRLFLLKVDEFLGVKLVLATPVLLTGLYYGLGLSDFGTETGWRPRRQRLVDSLRAIWSQPLLIGQVLVGLVALVAFAVVVARSGNDPGVGVSPVELKMRALLDHYLFVRPRTKEFLIGHPALFFALSAAIAGRYRKWIFPLLLLGAVGQSSLLDTFCHLHSPLYLSMLRALIGWILGALIGAIVFQAVDRTLMKHHPAMPEKEIAEAGA